MTAAEAVAATVTAAAEAVVAVAEVEATSGARPL